MNTSAVNRFYNRFASLYDLVFNQVFREGRVEAMRAAGASPGARILEVGFGTGLTLPHYPEGVDVVGVDLSGPMLRDDCQQSSGNHISICVLHAAVQHGRSHAKLSG